MGLLISAGVETAIALSALGYLLFRSQNRRAAALAFVIALPMSPLAFYTVEYAARAIRWSLMVADGWFVPGVVILFAAPAQEPAKWLAAAVPMVRRAIRSQPVTMALVVGLGFSIGEAWFVTLTFVWMFSGSGYTDPWDPWRFSGFVIDWLGLSFLHGAFVALPFAAFARSGSFLLFLLGGLAGMTLHFFLSYPSQLLRFDFFGLGNVWALVLVWCWMTGFVVACALMLWWLARRPSTAVKT